MKKSIPNILTLCNLFCGCLAVKSAIEMNFTMAFYLVIAGVIFDFMDGFAARLLGAYSEMGKQLDSLADMVTFGVAPAMVIYMAGLEYVALLIALFSALRLAKFNVDERQGDSFIGLPTPANALFFMSIGYIILNDPYTLVGNFFKNGVVMTFLTLMFSYLMVAEIKMFSLKFKSYKISDNLLIYIFLLASLVSIVIFKVFAIPFIIIVYISASIVSNFVTSRKA